MKKTTYYLQTVDGAVIRTLNPEYYSGLERMPAAEGKKLYRAQVVADIKSIVKPGQHIYCVLRSVSSSGMSRRISLFAVHKGALISLDDRASVLTGRTVSAKGGIACNGCGMDMGFELVYSLGRAIWPNGTPKAHGTRNGEADRDGGYALKHVWI